MLELKNVVKEYPAGDGKIVALKGIDLQFRKSEFVSILGPSGCGKTTMLNIIGGLDQYTSGDLIINGTSTKDFKDRDWDSYRNHSIGFVFQSYNLIPHQTVLQNVELALTLSGVSKSERRQRAKQALEQVGLGNQINKKPNQMSGGQMQRVAIARALVNNPDIILADEPTGALDTETSVQVMEILKEISKDRLIIMVTHNPELASRYSSRIIKMLDGEIIDDSMPLSDEEVEAARRQDEEAKKNRSQKDKKPSMSFGTSFMLSLKNLFTKKGRTLLTAFAGSIGIIGIALILSISNGTTTYIDEVQENALASYPITIESSSVDLSSLMMTFMNVNNSERNHDLDGVYKKSAVFDIVDAMNNLETTENDLKSFKEFLESELDKSDSTFNDAVNGLQYSYDLNMEVYTKNSDGEIIKSDTQQLMQGFLAEYMNIDASTVGMNPFANSSSALSSIDSMSMVPSLWQEMLPGKNGEIINDLIYSQYDLIYGAWPNEYNEIVLVVDKNNELDDLTLYALGLLPKEEIDKVMEAAFNGEELEFESKKWTFEEVCGTTYRTILNSSCYNYDEKTGTYTDLRETEAGLRYLYDNGIDLKVTGIIRPDEESGSHMLTGTIGYTSKLTEYLIDSAEGADVIEAQLASPDKDVLSGLPFENSTGTLDDVQKAEEFKNYVSAMTTAQKAEAYVKIKSIPDDKFISDQVSQVMAEVTREQMEQNISGAISQEMSLSEEELANYLSSMSDEDLTELYSAMVAEQVKTQYAQEVEAQMSSMSDEQLAAALDGEIQGFTDRQCATYYDDVLEFSESTYEQNLIDMGYIDLESPATINIYASSFENKDVIKEEIDKYNAGVDDETKEIKYTDYIGLMLSSVTTIINAITYVLIAFVAISLIVSSIMIGVITLISVQERTKEIGILRAIGASKKDVSSMFNAETMIIGFAAGFIGVMVTVLLCIPINIIIHAVTDINTLNARLPFAAGIILILISVGLTLISGLIPSRSAAKKDPVVALRTE